MRLLRPTSRLLGRTFAFLAPLSIAFQIALFGGDQTVFLVFTAVMVLGGLITLAARGSFERDAQRVLEAARR